VVVSRGDVSLAKVLDSLPREWEKIVVNNAREPQDYMVYGRYVGCSYASNDLIYVQDDDVIVCDPEEIVVAWKKAAEYRYDGREEGVVDQRDYVDHVACNMPQEFRHDFYTDHALVGFGAVFHRSLPERTFQRFLGPRGNMTRLLNPTFLRCCDIAFTALNPRVLVDVPKQNLPWCDAPNRMWKQQTHQGEREQFLAEVLRVRDF
jgi:hypothetical protein